MKNNTNYLRYWEKSIELTDCLNRARGVKSTVELYWLHAKIWDEKYLLLDLELEFNLILSLSYIYHFSLSHNLVKQKISAKFDLTHLHMY